MAGRQLALRHQLLDGRRELEQAKGVADSSSALADARRDLVVGQVEVLDELLIRGGFLERIEVLAVQVLDQRMLE